MPDMHQVSRRDFLKLASLVPPALLTLSNPPLGLTAPVFQPNPATPYNILIVVFDALSACNMSVYNYARQTTPVIDRLAKRAYVYHRHHSGADFTTPGTASLLTGVYPWSHRAINVAGEALPSYADRNVFAPFDGEYRTFAVSQNEYANIIINQMNAHVGNIIPTPAISLASFDYLNYLFPNDFFASSTAQELVFNRAEGPSSSYFLQKLLGYWKKQRLKTLQKELKDEYPTGLPSFLDRHFFTINAGISRAADEMAGKQPFLGYVHLIPPHAPYVPSKDYQTLFLKDGLTPESKPRSRFAQKYEEPYVQSVRRVYDAFISEVDAAFGRLHRRLTRSGLLENTIVVLTSDHGELFERGIIGHSSHGLYDALTHIPLLIWTPWNQIRHDIQTPTSAVDVLPTLMALTGRPAPEWSEGRVLPEILAEPVQKDRSIFAMETKSNRKLGAFYTYTLAMVKEDYKLVHYAGQGEWPDWYELYNIGEDPQELDDLYGKTGKLEAALQEELLDMVHTKGNKITLPEND